MSSCYGSGAARPIPRLLLCVAGIVISGALCAAERDTLSLDGSWRIDESVSPTAIPTGFVRTVPVPGLADMRPGFSRLELHLDRLIAERAALNFHVGLRSRRTQRGPVAICPIAPQLDARSDALVRHVIQARAERGGVGAKGVGVLGLPEITGHLLDVPLGNRALGGPIDGVDLR